MSEMKYPHLAVLGHVLLNDQLNIVDKDVSYNSSWKARGGVGAFMMMARKWDRIESLLQKHDRPYDIFDHATCVLAERQGTDGTILAEVRDLRRYLALVEAELVARGVVELAPDGRDYLGAKELVWYEDVHSRLLASGVIKEEPLEPKDPPHLPLKNVPGS